MRILVVKLSSLGDLFHVLPSVHRLKVGLQAEVDWVVQTEYAELVRCFPDVSRVIPFHRRSVVSHLASFVRDLRAASYDYVVDFQGLLKSAVVARLARARVRVGPSFHREGSAVFYTMVAGRRDKSRHAVEENLEIAAALSHSSGEPEFLVRFPGVALTSPSPRIAMVPSSRWPTKNWPVERFVEVARRLETALNPSFFLLGSEADRPACERIETSLRRGHAVNLAGRQSLIELGGLLQEMDLLIANDSGPVHMAAAVGTRTLVIFGPTDPRRTGPYGAGHRVIHAETPCRPCLSRQCRRGGAICLTDISSDRVAEAALEVLTAGTSHDKRFCRRSRADVALQVKPALTDRLDSTR